MKTLSKTTLLMGTVLAGFGMFAPLAAHAQTAATQSPGSITVRLNGRVNWYAGIEASSLDNNSSTGDKTSTDNFLGYIYLFPGFDGVAANGLHYGAAAELRLNSTVEATGETPYVYQAYGYLGLPKLGQISFGAQNGPSAIFETGTFESFNDGGWDGDIEGMVPAAANPVYPFPDYANDYDITTNKIVYLSPTLHGFQFAVGFTPNQTADNYSDAPTSVTTPILGGLPRNMVDIGGQYTKSYGPVGIQLGLDYTTAGQVNYIGPSQPDVATSYHNMNIIGGGATVTYAGFTFGGSSYYGNYNVGDEDEIGLRPDGGSAAVAWLVGSQYTAGPFTVGGSFFRTNETGDLPGGVDAGSGASISANGLTSGQQQDDGVAAGMTYTLVSGVNLFVDYLYGIRQQGGYDFETGDAGTDHNNVQSQLFGVGTQLQW